MTPNPLRVKTDLKAVNPITSKPGTLALLNTQAQYLLALLQQIPSKGAFAIHKARVIAVAAPQFTDWNTGREALLTEHALTELINSETPDGGKRVLIHTQEDVDIIRASATAGLSGKSVYLPQVNEAKFASDEARIKYFALFEAFNKDMLITWDTGASANLWKAVKACQDALVGDACPLIGDAEVFLFERLLEEVETALALSVK